MLIAAGRISFVVVDEELFFVPLWCAAKLLSERAGIPLSANMLLPVNALFGDDDDDDDASDAFSFRGVGATVVLRGNVLLVAAVFARCVKLGLFCCVDNDAEELFNCTLPMDRDACKLNALTSF